MPTPIERYKTREARAWGGRPRDLWQDVEAMQTGRILPRPIPYEPRPAVEYALLTGVALRASVRDEPAEERQPGPMGLLEVRR